MVQHELCVFKEFDHEKNNYLDTLGNHKLKLISHTNNFPWSYIDFLNAKN